MLKNIIFVILAVMLFLVPGCQAGRVSELEDILEAKEKEISAYEKELGECIISSKEKERFLEDIEEKIFSLNETLEKQNGIIAGQEEKIFSQNSTINILREEIEILKEETEDSVSEISADIIGKVSFEELIELSTKFFPNALRSTSYSKKISSSPFPLVSLETLEEFLAKDRTNISPKPIKTTANYCDETAFRLKDRWIKADLPPISLGLIKGKKILDGIERMLWRNIFITLDENHELVIYEVFAFSDEIKKIEEPDLETYRVLIADII
jgi:hypothetical protein